jgi:hypothetical protein
MRSQSLLQLRAVILHPAPDRCVIDMETALFQQFLNIAQRQRIAKIPPYRTNYEAGFGLTPFEDRGSGYHFAILSRHQPAALKVATHPFCLPSRRWLGGRDWPDQRLLEDYRECISSMRIVRRSQPAISNSLPIGSSFSSARLLCQNFASPERNHLS